jgi:hypothetical protein
MTYKRHNKPWLWLLVALLAVSVTGPPLLQASPLHEILWHADGDSDCVVCHLQSTADAAESPLPCIAPRLCAYPALVASPDAASPPALLPYQSRAPPSSIR